MDLPNIVHALNYPTHRNYNSDTLPHLKQQSRILISGYKINIKIEIKLIN